MALLFMEIFFFFLLVRTAVDQKICFLSLEQCFTGRGEHTAYEHLGELSICSLCFLGICIQVRLYKKS